MKIAEVFKKGAEALVLTAALGACSAPEANNSTDHVAVESVADKTKAMVDFCINSPSDVDGILCDIKRDGVPVASLEADCWQVREEGSLPISDKMAAALDGTDKLNIKADCEVQAGQW